MSKLYFKYGTMGSSKSMDLLRTAYNYEQMNMNVLLIKPSIDIRDNNEIKSRIGISKECILFNDNDNLFKLVETFNSSLKLNCILVDEVQFCTKEQIKELFNITKKLNIPVICYGLRINYKGEGFEASKELFILADKIEEIKTICECGKKATHHLLKINNKYIFSGESIHIGDKQFKAVCGTCWLKARGEV